VTPLDRLLAATERLLDDVSVAVVTQNDLLLDLLWRDDTDPNDVGVLDDMLDVFTVGTSTHCVQADTGTKGQVAVQVPEAAVPLPLAPCLAMSIVPGQLPGKPATRVTCPSNVPGGDAVVNVSIEAAEAPGLYVGHVSDQSGSMQRPFLIFLDGLTG
jgi:hypothetical protein